MSLQDDLVPLSTHDDPSVATAIASRILVEPDARVLANLLQTPHLRWHVPEVQEQLDQLAKLSPDSRIRQLASDACKASNRRMISRPPDLTQVLAKMSDDVRARFHREVIRLAVAALEPAVAALETDDGERALLTALEAWLLAPGPAALATLHEEQSREVIRDMGDHHRTNLRAAYTCSFAPEATPFDAAERVAKVLAELAKREPALAQLDRARAPHVAHHRALAQGRLLVLCLARLLAAGAPPLPPAPLARVMFEGEDVFEAFRVTYSPDELLANRNLSWLRLQMRPEEQGRYRAAWEQAIPWGVAQAAKIDLRVKGSVPADMERLAQEHGGRAFAAWLIALVAREQRAAPTSPLPALRLGEAPYAEATSFARAEKAVTEAPPEDRARVMTVALAECAARREKLWWHDPAPDWLRSARSWAEQHFRAWLEEPLPHRLAEAKQAFANLEAQSRAQHWPLDMADESSKRALLLDPRAAADAVECARLLGRAFFGTLSRQIAAWHLELAFSVVKDKGAPKYSIFGESLDGSEEPLGEDWALLPAGTEDLADVGQRPLLVRMDPRVVLLERMRPTEVGEQGQPRRVGILLRCPRCAVSQRAEAPVVFAYIDDDHYESAELGYEAKPSCACPSCRDTLSAELQLSLARSRGTGRAQLSWDRISERSSSPAR